MGCSPSKESVTNPSPVQRNNSHVSLKSQDVGQKYGISAAKNNNSSQTSLDKQQKADTDTKSINSVKSMESSTRTAQIVDNMETKNGADINGIQDKDNFVIVPVASEVEDLNSGQEENDFVVVTDEQKQEEDKKDDNDGDDQDEKKKKVENILLASSNQSPDSTQGVSVVEEETKEVNQVEYKNMDDELEKDDDDDKEKSHGSSSSLSGKSKEDVNSHTRSRSSSPRSLEESDNVVLTTIRKGDDESTVSSTKDEEESKKSSDDKNEDYSITKIEGSRSSSHHSLVTSEGLDIIGLATTQKVDVVSDVSSTKKEENSEDLLVDSEEDENKDGDGSIGESDAKAEDNVITDQTELPIIPAASRPAPFSCFYGSSRAKWPIRNFCKIGLDVNAKYGGCASLLLCSNSYGGKSEEGTAEIFLVRSGFDCNYFSVASIIGGNSGHFGTQNSFRTDEDGHLLGDLMFGNNVTMILTNDCKNGMIDNGLFVQGSPDKDDVQSLFINSSGNTPDLPGCSNVLVLCSGSEAGMGEPKVSCAAYFIRTGFGESFIQSKLIHGDDAWKFSCDGNGIIQATGVCNSRFAVFCNKRDRIVSENGCPKSQVFFAQATDGSQPTTVWDNLMDHGVLFVVCSNSRGREDCTAAALYMITMVTDGQIVNKLIKETFGHGYSGSDIWKFEIIGGKSISVSGPQGPCRYMVLSNMEDKDKIQKFQQTLCLGTGEPHPIRGEVIINEKVVKGIVDKPSKVSVEVEHRIIANFSENQLKKVKDGWAFCREWKEGEIRIGNQMVRVQAIRKHVTTNKEMFLQLDGSPKQVVIQKEGVMCSVNCGGPVYTSIDDITYMSEHKLFVNFSYDFNWGSRHRTYGKNLTKSATPSLFNKTHDGFMYNTQRHPSTEAADEHKAHFDVEVPNGSYILRLHFLDRIGNTEYSVNGVNVTSKIRTFSDAQKDVIREHKGWTAYSAEIPVNVSDGMLQIRTKAQPTCAFALLDMSKYRQKEITDIEMKKELEAKQKLMDTTEPLQRSLNRKELEIVGWSQNLLKNASGESGDLSYWNTAGSWQLMDGGHGTEKAFTTGHMNCTKYQEVNLREYFSEAYLDTAPEIQVLEWYREGVCGGGFYKLDVTLMDSDGNTVKSFSTGKIGAIYKNNQWTEAGVTFSDYGPGVRYVGFSSFGKDDKFWAGNYGAIMSGAEIRVRRETKPAPDDTFTDIDMSINDGVTFSSNRDKLVAKVLLDNEDLMKELLEDEVLGGEQDLTYIEQAHVGKKKVKPRKFRKREIRVFVSSTFRDFGKEREQLIKKTFREINQLCTDRGVFFTYVDLRWGITAEQTEHGQTIAICLQEIDRCRPYFICMLGQRFGWCQKTGEIDDGLNKSFDYALENHPSLAWINDYRFDTSVTQLEVMHGVLNDVISRKDRSFFYLREPPDPEKCEPAEFKTKSAESEWHEERQNSLRKKIADTEELNVRQFVSPDEVGDLIKKDLEDVLDKDFPKGTELSPLEREREAHQAFADVRCQVYIGRVKYFEDIDDAMNRKLNHPFVLLGESGSGKSALVANWVKRVREKDPEAFVFVHFIGSSAESASYVKMLRRLYEEIRATFEIDMTIPTSDINLVLDLNKWIKIAASASKDKVIIVMDALNQLDDGTGEEGSEHELLWVPRDLPDNVFILMSTLPGKAMDAVVTAGWETLKVEPLDNDQKKEIIVGYLEGIYSKRLSEEQKQMVVDAPQTNNPLYLRSLLDEVRVYGSFRTLTNKIQEYLTAGNPGDLFAKILERLEDDFEKGIDQRKRLVRDTTTAIWCSHRGMSEGELTEFLNVPSAVWSPFYLSLVENLVNRNGIVNFFHDHLRQAVEKKYLGTGEEKVKTFKELADFFSQKELDDRVVDELPYLLARAGDLERLRETISNLKVFSRLMKTEDGRFDLVKSWQMLGSYSEAEKEYFAKLNEVSEEEMKTAEYTTLLDELGDFFIQIGLYNAAVHIYERLVAVLEKKYAVSHGTVVYDSGSYSWRYRCKHPEVINALHQLGHVCEKQKALKQGAEHFMEAVSRQNRIVTPSQKLQLCEGLLGLASVRYLQENMNEAKKLLFRCLELSTDVLGKRHHYVAAILNKLGKLCYSQSRLEEAIGYFLQDLKLTRSDVGMAHPRIAGILNDLAMVYDDKSDPLAGEMYETALAMLLDTYGDAHVDVAVLRFNLGSFYFATDHFAKAKFQFQEAYKVFGSFLGEEHPDTKAAKTAMNDVPYHIAV